MEDGRAVFSVSCTHNLTRVKHPPTLEPMATDMGRTHRVEVYTPAGRWKWGQWVNHRTGTGTYAERLARVAYDMLGAEPAGSTARVFRWDTDTLNTMTEVLTVTLPLQDS